MDWIFRQYWAIISHFIDEETEIQRSEVPVPPGY